MKVLDRTSAEVKQSLRVGMTRLSIECISRLIPKSLLHDLISKARCVNSLSHLLITRCLKVSLIHRNLLIDLKFKILDNFLFFLYYGLQFPVVLSEFLSLSLCVSHPYILVASATTLLIVILLNPLMLLFHLLNLLFKSI